MGYTGRMNEYRVGALSVLADGRDQDWLNRRLKAIDSDLHLELQMTVDDEAVWCVVEDTHRDEGERYFTVFEWRDHAGRPIPVPTDRIIEEFQRRRFERETSKLTAGQKAEQANQRRKERLDADTRDGHEELMREFERLRRRSPTVPRSPALARTRARKRARGVPDGV